MNQIYKEETDTKPQRRRGINWNVFKKTPSEKIELRNTKSSHNNKLRKHYGINWRKFINVPD